MGRALKPIHQCAPCTKQERIDGVSSQGRHSPPIVEGSSWVTGLYEKRVYWETQENVQQKKGERREIEGRENGGRRNGGRKKENGSGYN